MIKRLLGILRLLTMPCRGVVPLISQSFDQDLPRAERLAVRIHLLYCRACCRFRRQLRTLAAALQGCADHPETMHAHLPFTLTPDAKQRIKRTLAKPG